MPLSSADVLHIEFDVCIVGAGPAGLACAFSCHDQGLRVLVLEAGGRRPVAGKPDILAADIVNPAAHDPAEIVAASAIGGSTHWWAGRTMPFDPVDFRKWPISHDEMLPWWEKAAEFLGAKASVSSPAPGRFGGLAAFTAEQSESWGSQLNMKRRWRARIEAADGPAILAESRVTGLEIESERIVGARVLIGGENRVARARQVVLACGGLGGLKLLLLAQRERPALFGGADGPLGRGYMGHLTGAIADLVPSVAGDVAGFGFLPGEGGVTTRRRILPTEQTVAGDESRQGIGNIAFWLENPSIGDAAHGSAAASAKYLAAYGLGALSDRSKTGSLAPHFANVRRAPASALAGLGFAAGALLTARMTGQHAKPRRLMSSGRGGWNTAYHAEQSCDAANRVSLSADMDSVGLPKLKIDYRFGDVDIASVVRAHELLDRDLAAAGAGRLRMWGAREACVERVAKSARDGYHQLGGAAMSRDAATGVVDADGRAHGLENLWLASGSVFPSSGQANPTLTIVALAYRVAGTIAKLAAGSVIRAPSPEATRQDFAAV